MNGRRNFLKKSGLLLGLVVTIILLTTFFISNSAHAQGLVVEAQADPPFGETPEAIKFTAKVVKGKAVSFIWRFGDGKVCDKQICEHIYKEEGVYTVRLTVKDAAGNVVKKILTVYVEDECEC